jgi:lon-related putative ATP-dependent protease
VPAASVETAEDHELAGHFPENGVSGGKAMKTTHSFEVSIDKLRWTMDPASLPFETTSDIKPLEGIVGQDRAIEALRFGVGMVNAGYNIFVTGEPRSGRMAAAQAVLQAASKERKTPDDLCYVNNFKNPEEPILIRLVPGKGRELKKDIHDLIENLKSEIPRVFESQDYISRKKEIMDTYEKETRSFFVDLEKRVKESGFALVNLQVGQYQRPELMPIIDGEPMPMLKLEELVEKGRFPREEFQEIKEKYDDLRKEIDQIFLGVRNLQKEVQDKGKQVDRMMFENMAKSLLDPLLKKYGEQKLQHHFKAMLEDMAENLQAFLMQSQQQQQQTPPGMPMLPMGDPYESYKINLLVDNAEQQGAPMIVESYPTYRNLFGSIERVVDRTGIWRTDYSKIRSGSFVRANGGFLVINLMDAIMEPGVWPSLKRALKSEKMEIQTFDPLYFFTSTGLRPEPVDINTKVVLVTEPYLYHLLSAYDPDVGKIFKVRADFDYSMNKTDENVTRFSEFVRRKIEDDGLRPFDRSAVATLVEEAVRWAGRQEKLSSSFPRIADLLREANYWAGESGKDVVSSEEVDRAVDARIYRANMIEEKIQEMIDRGTLMIDVEGEVVGQVNGLAVYSTGDYMFGKPTRITAATSIGKEGIINIEKEAEMSGRIHNKGVLVLSGYLRRRFAQNKPLSMSASIAFEQSYSGVDGDSASSTEIYALLSSLTEVPIKQYIAVTGSVNQKGEVQAIGGVNQKIEGFYHCCKAVGLTGKQGVVIPESNVKDLMLRRDVLEAVRRGEFHIYSVKTIDQGIEILTGMEAGEQKPDGSYPEGTINFLANAKLEELALGLKQFGEEEREEKKSPETAEAAVGRSGKRCLTEGA